MSNRRRRQTVYSKLGHDWPKVQSGSMDTMGKGCVNWVGSLLGRLPEHHGDRRCWQGAAGSAGAHRVAAFRGRLPATGTTRPDRTSRTHHQRRADRQSRGTGKARKRGQTITRRVLHLTIRSYWITVCRWLELGVDANGDTMRVRPRLVHRSDQRWPMRRGGKEAIMDGHGRYVLGGQVE